MIFLFRYMVAFTLTLTIFPQLITYWLFWLTFLPLQISCITDLSRLDWFPLSLRCSYVSRVRIHHNLLNPLSPTTWQQPNSHQKAYSPIPHRCLQPNSQPSTTSWNYIQWTGVLRTAYHLNDLHTKSKITKQTTTLELSSIMICTEPCDSFPFPTKHIRIPIFLFQYPSSHYITLLYLSIIQQKHYIFGILDELLSQRKH